MTQNKYWLLTFFYIIFAIGFGLGLSLVVRRLPDAGQPRSGGFRWIYAGHPVIQTFTPGHNGINVITVYLKNVGLRNRDPFYFTLADDSGVIRSVDLNGYNIGDGDNVRFQFQPVSDSEGKNHTISLASGSPQSLAIGAGFDQPTGSIAYQSFYFPTSRISVLSTVTGDFLKKVIQPRFVGLLILLFCLSLTPVYLTRLTHEK